jgi:hypothetical protein
MVGRIVTRSVIAEGTALKPPARERLTPQNLTAYTSLKLRPISGT